MEKRGETANSPTENVFSYWYHLTLLLGLPVNQVFTHDIELLASLLYSQAC